MRKILFFALALVASVVAFTSCDKKQENALIGKWSFDTEKDASGYYETQTLIIGEKDFAFHGQQHNPQNPDFIAIMLLEGTYELDGDIINAHFLKHGWNHNGEIEYITGWEGYDEKIKFSIDGKKLTIIRNYGEEHPNEPQVFTKQ